MTPQQQAGSAVFRPTVPLKVPFPVPFLRGVFAGQAAISAVSAVGLRKWPHTRGGTSKGLMLLPDGNNRRFNGTNGTAGPRKLALTCGNPAVSFEEKRHCETALPIHAPTRHR